MNELVHIQKNILTAWILPHISPGTGRRVTGFHEDDCAVRAAASYGVLAGGNTLVQITCRFGRIRLILTIQSSEKFSGHPHSLLKIRNGHSPERMGYRVRMMCFGKVTCHRDQVVSALVSFPTQPHSCSRAFPHSSWSAATCREGTQGLLRCPSGRVRGEVSRCGSVRLP